MKIDNNYWISQEIFFPQSGQNRESYEQRG